MSGGQSSPGRTRAALGQNLFAAASSARALVARAGISPGERVYDLGAGTGLIAAALADAGAEVVAVERDPNLARKLRQRFAGARAVCVLEADLADVAFRSPFKVVASPPFGRTAQLLRRLTAEAPAPQAAALVLQREAARKWAGLPRPTAVSLAAAPWFAMSVAEPFRRRDFVPAPAVNVAVLSLARRPRPDLEDDLRAAWTGFVRHVFGRGRADARGAFRGLLSHLQWRRLAERLGYADDARLAELAYDDWLAIFRFALTCAPREKQRRAGLDATASRPSPSGGRGPATRASARPPRPSPSRSRRG